MRSAKKLISREDYPHSKIRGPVTTQVILTKARESIARAWSSRAYGWSANFRKRARDKTSRIHISYQKLAEPLYMVESCGYFTGMLPHF